MRKLIAAFSASAFACLAMPALSDDLYNAMNVKPLSLEETAKLRAERDAAKANWSKLTPEEKIAVKQTAQQKRVVDLNTIEILGQNDDIMEATNTETAELRAERAAAKVKWDKMTPQEKAAVRQAALQKRASELTMIERVGQEDDISRYFSY